MRNWPAVEVCEVSDVDCLVRFRAKWGEWQNQMSGTDPHAVWNQIHAMLWDVVLFRTVNDLRRDAQERPEGGVGFNAPVLRLFDVGFLTTQVVAIRRLTEKQAKQDDRRVISLRAVLDEIYDHRGLITRENYVAGNGLPYDDEAAFRRWAARQDGGAGAPFAGPVPNSGPEGWAPARVAHQVFDRLAEVVPERRGRDDLISEQCLAHLRQSLAVCEDVRKFTDKFVAHAAEPENRDQLDEPQKTMSLQKLAAAQRAIFRVAHFVSDSVLWASSVSPVPVPQYDHLSNLENSWIGKGGGARALDHWRTREREIEAWQSERIWPTEPDPSAPEEPQS